MSHERHRFSYEGATGLLAHHLITTHNIPQPDVAPFIDGLTQGHWVALDDIHRKAHEEEDSP